MGDGRTNFRRIKKGSNVLLILSFSVLYSILSGPFEGLPIEYEDV